MKTHLLAFVLFMLLIPIVGNAQIQIFPNPVTGRELNISSQGNMVRLEIYNILGEKIFEDHLHASERSIDTSNLKSGMYMLKIYTSDNKSSVHKVIKK